MAEAKETIEKKASELIETAKSADTAAVVDSVKKAVEKGTSFLGCADFSPARFCAVRAATLPAAMDLPRHTILLCASLMLLALLIPRRTCILAASRRGDGVACA